MAIYSNEEDPNVLMVQKQEAQDMVRSDVYDEVQEWLIQQWIQIGCDRPDNHDDICQWIMEDVLETADLNNYHSGDFAIGFRRWIESQQNV